MRQLRQVKDPLGNVLRELLHCLAYYIGTRESGNVTSKHQIWRAMNKQEHGRDNYTSTPTTNSHAIAHSIKTVKYYLMLKWHTDKLCFICGTLEFNFHQYIQLE